MMNNSRTSSVVWYLSRSELHLHYHAHPCFPPLPWLLTKSLALLKLPHPPLSSVLWCGESSSIRFSLTSCVYFRIHLIFAGGVPCCNHSYFIPIAHWTHCSCHASVLTNTPHIFPITLSYLSARIVSFSVQQYLVHSTCGQVDGVPCIYTSHFWPEYSWFLTDYKEPC